MIGTTWRQIGGTLGLSLFVTIASLALPLGVILHYGLSADHFWPQSLVAGLGGITCWIACIFAMRHPFRDEILLGLRHSWSALRRTAAMNGEKA